MQKALKAASSIMGGVLFIGFGVQIVLGICWMVCNFTGFQKFGDSVLYVEISKTFICDEYEGILYPVLIRMTKGIEGMILIPYHYIIYLLQIGFAFAAGYKLLQCAGVKERFWQLWGALVMLTVPMAMQCHLAVLPDSLVYSGLLLEIAFAIKVLLGGSGLNAREYCKVLILWLLIALMQPFYLYIGAIPVLLLFLFGAVKAWKKGKRSIVYSGLLVAAFLGMILGVKDLTQAEGYYGRVHQSIEASMASLFGWPFAAGDYEYWPAEAKACISWEQAQETSLYADQMERIVGRTLEQSVGEERARRLLGEIAAVGWQRHKGEIFRHMIWDAAGYTMSPIVVQEQLAGKGFDAYSGRNYDIMAEKTPLLTKYYMSYGNLWFVAGLIAAMIVLLTGIVKVLIEKKRALVAECAGKVLAIALCLLTAAMLVVLYTLRGAGMMDYKKSIIVTVLWIFGMLLCCVAGIREGKQSE